jgi:hypothetical protein
MVKQCPEQQKGGKAADPYTWEIRAKHELEGSNACGEEGHVCNLDMCVTYEVLT